MQRRTKTEQLSSTEVIRRIASQTDTVALSFSNGKDSLAAWLALTPHFKRIVPIYHYDIPGGLEFTERNLRLLERYFQTPIIRIPHVRLYQILAYQAFQPPHNVPILMHYDFPSNPTLVELKRYVLEDIGLPDDTWVALGTRAADSRLRFMTFRWHGAIREKNRTFFPVWDWKKADVAGVIKQAGLHLPEDYQVWGRSCDGIDYVFLKGLRDHFPADYAKVLEWFPLIDAEFARREIARTEGLLP